ncbi:MAG: hypothetical protein A2289_02365 [Deltaproteobacteria bacterium RIFOXYA12_FULL_58_15]|nr:MAG: hypothetical protein A2289_02365 [Deltaproteobacteria bacterium RIFOXYA12_FULL_58_15]
MKQTTSTGGNSVGGYFDKLRVKRTVLERSTGRKDLPKLVLYTEWLPPAQRKVVDTEGKEHVLDDKVVESHYGVVTGKQGKSLIDKHWKDEKAKAQEPVRAPVK